MRGIQPCPTGACRHPAPALQAPRAGQRVCPRGKAKAGRAGSGVSSRTATPRQLQPRPRWAWETAPYLAAPGASHPSDGCALGPGSQLEKVVRWTWGLPPVQGFGEGSGPQPQSCPHQPPNPTNEAPPLAELLGLCGAGRGGGSICTRACRQGWASGPLPPQGPSPELRSLQFSKPVRAQVGSHEWEPKGAGVPAWSVR